MTKAEIKEELEKYAGSPFINISKLAKCLHIRTEYAADICKNLDRIESGREKRYYTGDVARELIRRRVI